MFAAERASRGITGQSVHTVLELQLVHKAITWLQSLQEVPLKIKLLVVSQPHIFPTRVKLLVVSQELQTVAEEHNRHDAGHVVQVFPVR